MPKGEEGVLGVSEALAGYRMDFREFGRLAELRRRPDLWRYVVFAGRVAKWVADVRRKGPSGYLVSRVDFGPLAAGLADAIKTVFALEGRSRRLSLLDVNAPYLRLLMLRGRGERDPQFLPVEPVFMKLESTRLYNKEEVLSAIGQSGLNDARRGGRAGKG
ncbi:MAG TPA: hypothetical protein VHR45_19855 [Thermoanaerobaculia bacterium]|nr:hypothetical protein [Thermoanaerobaculia bacterium]